MTSRSKELAKNTVILFIGKMSTQFLTFFLLPLYTYMLQTESYGLVDLVLSYIVLLTPVVTIQQEMATFRYLIDFREDKKKSGEIIRTSIKSIFFRTLIFAIPYLVTVSILHWQYTYSVLLCAISMVISNLFLQIARGFGCNSKYTIGSIIAGVVTILSNLFLICVCDLGAQSILFSAALANMCCSIYLFFSLGILGYLKGAKSDKMLRKKMLKFSWPLIPNSISWWLINASDRTIISIFIGTSANGIYAIVGKFPAIVSNFVSVFSLSWTESASLHINDDDHDKFFSKVASNNLRIFSSLSILIVASIPFIFDVIIGPEYREAYVYIPIAVLGAFLNSMISVYSAIYIAKKMMKQVATTSLIAAVINIIVDFILIHFVGLYAAVISTAVAYFVMMVYRHFDIKKYVHIKYKALDIAMAGLGIAVILPIYYSNNYILYIVGVVLAVLYAVTRNWALIRQLAKRIFRR